MSFDLRDFNYALPRTIWVVVTQKQIQTPSLNTDNSLDLCHIYRQWEGHGQTANTATSAAFPQRGK
jgi:hypothetical protein